MYLPRFTGTSAAIAGVIEYTAYSELAASTRLAIRVPPSPVTVVVNRPSSEVKV